MRQDIKIKSQTNGHITKLMHSFAVNIRICQTLKVMFREASILFFFSDIYLVIKSFSNMYMYYGSLLTFIFDICAFSAWDLYGALNH